MKQMIRIWKFLAFFVIFIALGGCAFAERAEEKAAMTGTQSAVPNKTIKPVDGASPPECAFVSPRHLGGNEQSHNFFLGYTFTAGGRDNIYNASTPGLCVLKLPTCSVALGGTTIEAHQYHVVSCHDAPATGCLTDLGNGNKVAYSPPCPDR